MSNYSLLVIPTVGLVAGWLAGHLMRGAGHGLVGDLIVGVVGGYIDDCLLAHIGIMPGTGIIVAIFYATIGAPLLLLVLPLVAARSPLGQRLRTAFVLTSVTARKRARIFRSTPQGAKLAVDTSCEPRRTIGLVEALVNPRRCPRENTRCAC